MSLEPCGSDAVVRAHDGLLENERAVVLALAVSTERTVCRQRRLLKIRHKDAIEFGHAREGAQCPVVALSEGHDLPTAVAQRRLEGLAAYELLNAMRVNVSEAMTQNEDESALTLQERREALRVALRIVHGRLLERLQRQR